ncbi:hypothetical protein LPB19_08125 [Marinobacter salinisoli]|uniref:Uncharacterized protein n=1 Tax=Marinobacter salinisoli TaxID=2769486 RepID=A0ABX7MVC3_9GAMM|nr:hypothetical protein [Marinobacter salinisoli]QSP96330.1 hypothetical protein LPB19_08125 [Marinobacter salinisoli]
MTAVRELETVLPTIASNSMLRYEAFTRLLALLGSMPDGDTVEIIQTGLGELQWEQLLPEDRERFADHLRHLADQVSPLPVDPPPPVIAGLKPDAPEQSASHGQVSAPEYTRQIPPADEAYDQQRFGEQSRLVEALKETPADMSLQRLLDSLMHGSGDRS